MSLEKLPGCEPNAVEMEARVKNIPRGSFLKRAERKIAAIVLGATLALGAGTYTHLEKRRQTAIVTMGEKIKNMIPEDLMKQASEDHGRYELAEKTEPIIGGFEQMGFSDEAMREIFEKTFPQAWTKNTVKVIGFRGHDLKLSEEYGKKLGGTSAAAVCRTISKEGGKPAVAIEFGLAAKENSPAYVYNDLFAHEMAHAHDFRLAFLPPEIKKLYLMKVAGQLYNEHRFKSNYVESIGHDDKKKEFGQKATEYFAEILSVYFADPVAAEKKLPAIDIDIVRSYLKIVAPEFDVRAAATTRKEIIDRQTRVDYAKKIPVELARFMEEHDARDVEGFVKQDVAPVVSPEAAERFSYLLTEMSADVPKQWSRLQIIFHKKIGFFRLARVYFNGQQKHLVIPAVREAAKEQEKFDRELQKLKPKDRKKVVELFQSLEKLYTVTFSDVAHAYAGIVENIDEPEDVYGDKK
ncbi:MAG: hypothetical protein AAB731_03235 [Patescibacteria group bacterium]